MTTFLKNCFSKQNLFYTLTFVISMAIIITNRILMGFGSILWIADLGSIFGILYVIFMAKHSIWGFVFNILATIFICATSFIQHVWLNSFVCVAISLPNLIFGLVMWIKNKKQNREEQNLKNMNKKGCYIWWGITLGVSALFTVVLWLIGGNLFYIDGTFSAMCVVGVILSSRMYIQQYHFFIPANMLGVALYVVLTIQSLNNLPYVITNIIYTIVSVMGLINWKKLQKNYQMQNQQIEQQGEQN